MRMLVVATKERLGGSSVLRLPANHATGSRAKPLFGLGVKLRFYFDAELFDFFAGDLPAISYVTKFKDGKINQAVHTNILR